MKRWAVYFHSTKTQTSTLRSARGNANIYHVNYIRHACITVKSFGPEVKDKYKMIRIHKMWLALHSTPPSQLLLLKIVQCCCWLLLYLLSRIFHSIRCLTVSPYRQNRRCFVDTAVLAAIIIVFVTTVVLPRSLPQSPSALSQLKQWYQRIAYHQPLSTKHVKTACELSWGFQLRPNAPVQASA